MSQQPARPVSATELHYEPVPPPPEHPPTIEIRYGICLGLRQIDKHNTIVEFTDIDQPNILYGARETKRNLRALYSYGEPQLGQTICRLSLLRLSTEPLDPATGTIHVNIDFKYKETNRFWKKLNQRIHQTTRQPVSPANPPDYTDYETEPPNYTQAFPSKTTPFARLGKTIRKLTQQKESG